MTMLGRKALLFILIWTITEITHHAVALRRRLRRHPTENKRQIDGRRMDAADENMDWLGDENIESESRLWGFSYRFVPASSSRDENDLGIRFTKVKLPDDMDSDSLLPLGANDYPINSTTAEWLGQSQCPSVVIPENCHNCNVDFEELVQRIGGHPTHPSADSSSPYWDELIEVAQVQAMRNANYPTSDIMPLPHLWENFTLAEVAEAVHDEYPGYHQAELIQYLMKDGVTVDDSIIPMRCKVEFLRGPVMLADLNTWAVATVGPPNFGVKYHVGRARPEEVAFMISQGNLTQDDGVPAEFFDFLPAGTLSAPEKFTAYPEGSPMHPSWPAMHSAASSSSLWLAVVLNLTHKQWCEAKLMDYAVAYARTVAGVHYASDNIAGLDLGQELIANVLPEHLEYRYGSDPDAVRAKIASLRFNWTDFLASDCIVSTD